MQSNSARGSVWNAGVPGCLDIQRQQYCHNNREHYRGCGCRGLELWKNCFGKRPPKNRLLSDSGSAFCRILRDRVLLRDGFHPGTPLCFENESAESRRGVLTGTRKTILPVKKVQDRAPYCGVDFWKTSFQKNSIASQQREKVICTEKRLLKNISSLLYLLKKS